MRAVSLEKRLCAQAQSRVSPRIVSPRRSSTRSSQRWDAGDFSRLVQLVSAKSARPAAGLCGPQPPGKVGAQNGPALRRRGGHATDQRLRRVDILVEPHRDAVTDGPGVHEAVVRRTAIERPAGAADDADAVARGAGVVDLEPEV